MSNKDDNNIFLKSLVGVKPLKKNNKITKPIPKAIVSNTSRAIIKELEKNYPIVGYIEDPLMRQDIDGWRRVREATGLPTIMHGTPFGGIQEIMFSQADIYMIGGSMGDSMATGFAYGKANIQVILQFEGGTLGKAMAMHMASVLPSHTAHSINLDDQYEDDVTCERIDVVAGFSKVPEGPGLGVEVDEDALAEMLDSGHVAGAALDVFVTEPAKESPLFGKPGFICTPHLGASTVEAQDNVGIQSAHQVVAFLSKGKVDNAVNAPRF